VPSTCRSLRLCVCVFLWGAGGVSIAAPVGTGFTYQGQLKQSGVPLNGSANMVFKLFDAPAAGNLLGTQTINGVPLTNGFFTVELNAAGQFGADAFNGEQRWLEVSVNGTPLAPRQALASTPYALHALDAPGGASNWQDSGDDVFLPRGNVGVGTNAPTSVLHIQRPLSDTGIRFQSSRFNQGPPASSGRAPVSVTVAGTGQSWSTPGAAIVSDDLRADAGFSAAAGAPDADSSQSLHLTNFGFTLPSQATIVGIVVTVEGRTSCGCADCDLCSVPVTGELLGGTDASQQKNLTFTAADSSQAAGGTFDAWGLGWTAAQVNSPSFGVQLSAKLQLLDVFFCIPQFGCSYTTCDCTGTGAAGIDATSVTVFFYDTSVTSTPLDWSVGLSQSDANFRISPTPDLSSPSILVTPQGNVGIGTTDFGGGIFKLSVNGFAAKPNGGQWSALSDARLKRNIEPLTGALERMLSLRGVTFEFTEEGLRTGLALPGRHVGLIAQDVEPVFPDWVAQTPSGYKFVTEQGTTALLVEALRELRSEKTAEFAALRAEKDAEIRAGRAEMAELKERLARLEELVQQLGTIHGEDKR
jgi:hypothetical protein